MAKKASGDQKLYRNAGVSFLVLEGVEIEPGAEFRATLDPAHEAQLLEGGHVEILQDQSARADAAQAAASEAGETAPGAAVVTEEEPSRRRSRL